MYAHNNVAQTGGVIQTTESTMVNLFIVGGVFDSNSALVGGAIYVDVISSNTLTISGGTVFSNNYASDRGGAIGIDTPVTTTVLRNTVVIS